MVDTKTCTKCGETKPVECFGPQRGGKYGVAAICNPCQAQRAREYRERNPSKAAKSAKEFYWRNRERCIQRSLDWAKDNPEKRRAASARFLENNPNYFTAWKLANPEKEAAKHRRANAKKLSTVKGRIENAIRSGFKRGLIPGTKGKSKTFELLGYTAEQLRIHLERQFTPGMSWDNFGEWQIDHRLPLASFTYSSPQDDEFKAAWSITNLQPLWSGENASKKDKRIVLL